MWAHLSSDGGANLPLVYASSCLAEGNLMKGRHGFRRPFVALASE